MYGIKSKESVRYIFTHVYYLQTESELEHQMIERAAGVNSEQMEDENGDREDDEDGDDSDYECEEADLEEDRTYDTEAETDETTEIETEEEDFNGKPDL